MPTFVLRGVSFSTDGVPEFFGTTDLTITLPEGQSSTYTYGPPVLGSDFVPAAVFGPESPPIYVRP